MGGSTDRLRRGKVEVALYILVEFGIIDRDRSCVRWIPQDVYIQLRFGQKIFDPSLRCAERSASGGIARKSET